MQVIVDGLLSKYDRSGKGKTIVLLHGWTMQADTMSPISAELSKYFDVVSPVLPGFQSTESPDHAWGLTDYAKYLANFLEKISVDKVFAFIGHSNGGAILIKGISSGLLSADKLVLLSSSGIRNKKSFKKSFYKVVTKTGKLVLKPLPDTTKKNLRTKFYKSLGSDMLVAENLSDSFKKIVSEDVLLDAKKLQLPTLLIYGENDTETPVLFGEAFHENINNSELDILTDAGHFVQLDQTIKVNNIIKRFLL